VVIASHSSFLSEFRTRHSVDLATTALPSQPQQKIICTVNLCSGNQPFYKARQIKKINFRKISRFQHFCKYWKTCSKTFYDRRVKLLIQYKKRTAILTQYLLPEATLLETQTNEKLALVRRQWASKICGDL